MTPCQTLCALALLLPLAACTTAGSPHVQPPRPGQAEAALYERIATLDAEVFAAFNTCGEPGQLARHASYFSPSVEFYHDNGGVTWTRDEMLANTQKFVCGNFRRELVAGSLRVYPVKDFGAIAQGLHRFCTFKTGTCEGVAEFLIVWRHEGAGWRITRVFSYGHRPA